MDRKLRIEYPVVIYHVLNRGNRRELIFHGDQDRESFCGTLAGVCPKSGWQGGPLCLMPNHFSGEAVAGHAGPYRAKSLRVGASGIGASAGCANAGGRIKAAGVDVGGLGATAQRRKGDPEKVQIARRLRQETTMTLPWIAGRLNMGAAGTLANLLRHPGRT